ncbi:RpiB/LacA/LacB family sugar-phosphate isomerase [Candidatus Parcubacteria bacterium]|jgi:ribose 5-phosphate isomerase B|nr:RpiB/LacA/LacB family sugar-phosphate isomerase [Candidatus Parcubacteria bacterium]
MIYLGADHNGFKLKEALKEYLNNKKIDHKDLGNTKFDQRDDYPVYAKQVARQVAKGKTSLGILICGSGQGMSMAANKFKNVRAALGWSVAAAKRARHDDDANIICIPAWRLTNDQAMRVIQTWLNTPFSKLARHKRRIKKINA